MKTFLQEVAAEVYRRYGPQGTDGLALKDVAIVFPNNRARHFFNGALLELSGGHALWTPQYPTLADLFSQLANAGTGNAQLRVGDPLALCGWLYGCYRDVFSEEEPEPFDSFYGWGNTLLHDFDNLDKNLSDARLVFRNIGDQQRLESNYDFLEKDQKELLERFFGRMKTGAERTVLMNRFAEVWNRMPELYERFRERQLAEGACYEGLLNRRALEAVAADASVLDGLRAEKYWLVGFNALNECEKRLFRYLKEAGLAEFCWDYDEYYLEDHEAGHFLRDRSEGWHAGRGNLSAFPPVALPEACFQQMDSREKRIRLVSSPTGNAQAHYAYAWIKERLAAGVDPRDLAIVLADESLLLPLLHRIPEELQDINVTMGYPLVQTPVYNLVRQLLLLHCDGCSQGRFLSRFSLPVLQNPYIAELSARAGEVAGRLVAENRFAADAGFFQGSAPLDSASDGDPQTSNAVAESSRASDAVAESSKASGAVAESSRVSNAVAESRMASEEFPEDSRDVLDEIFRPLEGPEQLGRLILNVLRRLSDREYERQKSLPAAQRHLSRDAFYRESLFLCHTTVSRLADVMAAGGLEVSMGTYRRLLLRVLDASIPFSGEPLQGAQLMGILETRNLDFGHVLILSANEGNLPARSGDDSFIPYNIRRAFGLNGPEHQDAITAYYFFRFLQRASDITLVYSTAADAEKGEMSRFLLQLEMEPPRNATVEKLELSNREVALCPLTDVPKTDEDLENVPREKFCFSPSSINNYLDCPMRFYYEKIRRLKPEDEISEEVDASRFGTMFHAVAQGVYGALMLHKRDGNWPGAGELFAFLERKPHEPVRLNVTASDLDELLRRDAWLDGLIDYQYQKEVFRIFNAEGKAVRRPVPQSDWNGQQRVLARVLKTYVRNLLRRDRDYAPFEILDLERRCEGWLPDQATGIKIGGIVDRMDLKYTLVGNQTRPVLRIVDYKTGGYSHEFNSMDRLFKPAPDRPYQILQTFVYASLLRGQAAAMFGLKEEPLLKPCLYYVNKFGDAATQTHISYNVSARMNDARMGTVEDIEPFYQEFSQELLARVSTLWDKSVPFTRSQVADPDTQKPCCYCDFRALCGR